MATIYNTFPRNVGLTMGEIKLAYTIKTPFLPGATGNTEFWKPLANQLKNRAAKAILGYPGFGREPATPAFNSFSDLVRMVVSHIDQPTALIGQSMGGLLATYAALERPDLVTHLVLAVTSGGIDMKSLGAQDWRDGFASAYPSLPDWFLSLKSDISVELREISQPVLLLWGDADPFSPVAVGRRLLELLPNARMHVVPGGDHDLAHVHARKLAPIVDTHLMQSAFERC
jgi:pimeloyl-ACP methyl ester carboxylesterase